MKGTPRSNVEKVRVERKWVLFENLTDYKWAPEEDKESLDFDCGTKYAAPEGFLRSKGSAKIYLKAI